MKYADPFNSVSSITFAISLTLSAADENAQKIRSRPMTTELLTWPFAGHSVSDPQK